MVRVGITQGDINGIGTEVIIKTFLDPAMLEVCTPIVFGSNKTATFHRKTMGIEDFSFNTIREPEQANPKRPNLVNIYEEEVPMELGRSTELGGKYALKSLEAACDALEKGKVDVLVTAPINKHNIQSENFKFPGHTEYLEMRFGAKGLMFLVSGDIRVGVVTGHVPVVNVSALLSEERILSRIQVMHKSLIEDFGIRKPKIAVMGLNPHAGDSGTIGNEEKNIIIPAINKAKEGNLMVYGPYSADGFFGSSAYTKFDGILAMYHDQGLIPFKTLAFNSGVNFTAGLPVIRTSPDHGTAYDIAGKNMADESSFRNAIYLAIDIFNKRNEYKGITANPLKSAPAKKDR